MATGVQLILFLWDNLFNFANQENYTNIQKGSKLVTPMLKTGLKRQCSSYRQTTLLTNSDDIIERLIYSKLFSSIEQKELPYLIQFGF